MSTLVKTPQISNPPQSSSMARQAIMNGNFDVWQRGTSFALASGSLYYADRWTVNRSAVIAGTISRQDGTGVDGSQYCIRIARSASEGAATLINGQALETRDSIKFVGKKLTMSFWARAGSGFSDDIDAYIYSGTGTDEKYNQFTGTVTEGSITNQALTTSWQKFSFTTSSAISSGKTQIGAGFSIPFTGTAPANDYVEFTQVQLNAGDEVLPFEPKSFGEELTSCQRYFEKSFNYVTAPANSVDDNWGHVATSLTGTQLRQDMISFAVEKRVAPTITSYSPATIGSGGNWGYWNGSWLTFTPSFSITTHGAKPAGTTTGLTGGNSYQILGHWTADAEL